MASSIESPLPALQSLVRSLRALQQTTDPLLKQPLQDIIGRLEQGSSSNSSHSTGTEAGTSNGLEGRLDAAKLYTAVAYTLLDLVWMHARVKGVDPTSHPVTAELERVKSYFAKIKYIESGQTASSSSTHKAGPTLPGQENRARLDQGAAGRFIKNSLACTDKGKHTKFDASSGEDSSDEGAKRIKATADADHQGKQDRGKGRIVKDPFEGGYLGMVLLAAEILLIIAKRRADLTNKTCSGLLGYEESTSFPEKKRKSDGPESLAFGPEAPSPKTRVPNVAKKAKTARR